MMTAWTGELAAKVVNTQSDSGFILKVRRDRICWQIGSTDEREGKDKNKLIEKEIRLVVTENQGSRGEDLDEGGQKLQTSSYYKWALRM